MPIVKGAELPQFVKLLLVLLAAAVIPVPASASEEVSEVFSNLEYPMEDAPGGKILLKNGVFSAPMVQGAASKFEAKLIGPLATGSWKGTQVAAVVLFYTEGGSGNFRRLYFLVKEKDKWTPRAWTDIGDRIKVRYLGLDNHGSIIIGMIAHGPEDPQCCPARKIARTYLVKGKKLLPVKTSLVEIFPDQVRFSRDLLGKDIKAVLVPEVGFSAHGLGKTAPYPSHVALVKDGKKILRIFPVERYKKMWLEHHDLTVQIAVKLLERIIQKKDKDLKPPLPLLPPSPGINDLAARAEVLQIQKGAGVGFIGRIARSLACVSPEQLKYFFSGISNKGKFIVSFQHEISVKDAPKKLWNCKRDVEGLKKQIETVAKTLGDMDEKEFSPSIVDLKAFLASIYIDEKTENQH